MEFTPDEQSYIRNYGKIKICVDPDWFPFERINEQGEHEGISADLLKVISNQTGLQFELIKTKSWNETLEASKTGKCQVVSFLNKTPQREQWLIFTDVLFRDPNVFITREEHEFISNPSYLSNETIVFPVGTSMEEFVNKNYPNLKIITVETEAEAIKLVSDKKVNMTMRSLIVAAYTIKKEGLFNLKIAGQLSDYTNNLRIGVTKHDLMLRDILNKGIQNITPQAKWEIVNKHVSINAQTVVDYSLIFKIIAGFCVLVATGLYWNYKLKMHNQELIKISQTDVLTSLFNRTKLNLQFALEFQRAKRYNRLLSVIIFDIDNFKKVNDELGHLMGDKALIAIAQAAKSNIRSSDTIGRWGGEEFLVICPETSSEDAFLVADKIRKFVKSSSPFDNERICTVSAGVAMLLSEDSMDSLLHRADTFLYQAKYNGRDQVFAG
jgi:diguanylate cyclase (GGDEF)-like protein